MPPPSPTRDRISSPNKHKKKRPWAPTFPYQVDYNDHFETPLKAYEDISPLLDFLAEGKSRKEHIIYDPYYCNGQTTTLFQHLGFENIIHRKRDFYQDILDKTLPIFDTLITNPPYSEQHKDQCLEFCFQQFHEADKCFFLLMPNYVASREYYRRRLLLGGTKEERQDEDVVYIIPSVSYDYHHPEGTGKETSPFASLWFCGLGKNKAKLAKEYWENMEWKDQDRPKPKLATSLEELKEMGAIPTEKRPNPRQRKKKRQHATVQSFSISSYGQQCPTGSANKKQRLTNPSTASSSTKQNHHNPNSKKRKGKSSKYRNGQGQREKKRF